MNELEFRNLVDNESIYVRGNGTLCGVPHKDDLVVGFNKSPLSCHISVQANIQDADIKALVKRRVAVCRFSRDPEHENMSIAFALMQTHYEQLFMSSVEAFDSCVAEVGYHRPLSGSMAVHYLVNFCSVKEITVDGMDCYSKSGCPMRVHKPSADFNYLKSMHEQKKINWLNLP